MEIYDGDPFAALGVRYDATPKAVRGAFRQRARETHPDHNPGLDGSAFRDVRAAYDALRDDIDGQRRRWARRPAGPVRGLGLDWGRVLRETDEYTRTAQRRRAAAEDGMASACAWAERQHRRWQKSEERRANRAAYEAAAAAHSGDADRHPLCPVGWPDRWLGLDWTGPVGHFLNAPDDWAPVGPPPPCADHVMNYYRQRDRVHYGVWAVGGDPAVFVFGPAEHRPGVKERAKYA